MDIVLDLYALWNGCGVQGQSHAEPDILTTKIVVFASKADGMCRLVKWLP